MPHRATQLKGLNAQILSVMNVAPGQKPTVTFQLTENDGTILAPAPFTSNLNLLMGGSTADYAINPFRERADAASFDGTNATYTFTHAIPADAKGTWTFSIEARRTVTLDPHPADATTFTEAAFNPIFDASVDGSAVAARRVVVDIANCNTCHDQLALHGGQRQNTQECVMCHNPNASDVARRPADQGPPESIDFKRLIHRIHSGENLSQDYTVYGFGTPPSVNNFNGVLLPGRPARLPDVPRPDIAAGPREPAGGPPPDGDAARLVHADAALRRGLPGLPRLAGGGGACLQHDRAVRRSLRDLPRSGRAVRGRQGARALGRGRRPTRRQRDE